MKKPNSACEFSPGTRVFLPAYTFDRLKMSEITLKGSKFQTLLLLLLLLLLKLLLKQSKPNKIGMSQWQPASLAQKLNTSAVFRIINVFMALKGGSF